MDPRLKDHIKIDTIVKIALTKNTPSDHYIEDRVAEIITEDLFAEDGIEVRTQKGYIGVVKEIVYPTPHITSFELETLIDMHETRTFEMKSTFMYDIRQSNARNKAVRSEILVREVVEGVAAFMNTNGGILCIGITDEKEVLGLEPDYSLLDDDKEKSDKFRSKINESLSKYMQDKIIHSLFEIEIMQFRGKEVCLIHVRMSPEPILVSLSVNYRLDNKDKNGTFCLCFIRSNNGTQKVDVREFIRHWDIKRKLTQ